MVMKKQNLLKEVREQVFRYLEEEHFRQKSTAQVLRWEFTYQAPVMAGGQCSESREE